MRSHQASSPVVEPQRGEESAAPQATAAEGEVVVIEVERRRVVDVQGAALRPVRERAVRALVPVVDLVVAGLGLCQLEADDVERITRVELCLLRRRDDVVGRRDDVGQIANDLLLVPQSVERDDLGHASSILAAHGARDVHRGHWQEREGSA